jgi:hypothetical protein
VILTLKFHIDLHANRQLELFRESLENYVADNPRLWESVVFFRCENIDTDSEFVIYKLKVRSRYSWQVAARVLANRSELRKFCITLATKMNVHFDSAAQQRVLYYGGSLVDGGVIDYKRNLLSNPNISTSAIVDPMLTAVSTKTGDDEAAVGTSDAHANADDFFLAMLKKSQE